MGEFDFVEPPAPVKKPREPQPPAKWERFAIAGLAVLGLFLVFSYFVLSFYKQYLDAKSDRINSLKLVSWTYDYSGYWTTIVGTVENRGKREFSYADIKFRLKDKSGAQVGTAWANTSNLPSGGAWSFQASTLGVKFDSAELAELSGF